jgi:hypothetical protein
MDMFPDHRRLDGPYCHGPLLSGVERQSQIRHHAIKERFGRALDVPQALVVALLAQASDLNAGAPPRIPDDLLLSDFGVYVPCGFRQPLDEPIWPRVFFRLNTPPAENALSHGAAVEVRNVLIPGSLNNTDARIRYLFRQKLRRVSRIIGRLRRRIETMEG